jgi:hypothetical protein
VLQSYSETEKCTSTPISSYPEAVPMRRFRLTALAKEAERVRVTEGPTIESAKRNFIIIKWTSNNPGGTDEHFGVVHYGTDPGHLSQTAQSPVRLNQNHASTVFRVRVDGLKSQTTYYYAVDSMQGNGKSDGVKAPSTTSPVLEAACRSDPRKVH